MWLKSSNTDQDVIDLKNLNISRTKQNKKNLSLFLRCNILRSYCFVVEITKLHKLKVRHFTAKQVTTFILIWYILLYFLSFYFGSYRISYNISLGFDLSIYLSIYLSIDRKPSFSIHISVSFSFLLLDLVSCRIGILRSTFSSFSVLLFHFYSQWILVHTKEIWL